MYLEMIFIKQSYMYFAKTKKTALNESNKSFEKVLGLGLFTL